ncbi:MAG: glycosyltransferase [Deltaproteobacteria bacterium]|nr:glycosyltransferase [Deltaproteobacteria bacterium]
MARVVLVVPCYNEAARLPVEELASFVLPQDELRMLFVDDGSTDETREVLTQLVARAPERLAMLALERNGGKSEAVRRGVLHALDGQVHGEADWVGYWDADLATPLEEVERFCAVLREEPDKDVVFGARVRLLGRHIDRKLYRHLYGRAFVTAVSTMLALPIYDSQCGAKLFRAGLDVRAAFATPFISRWIFDVEVLARLIGRYEARGDDLAHHLVEVPLRRWSDVAGSKITSFDAARAAGELARIGLEYRDILRARRRRRR